MKKIFNWFAVKKMKLCFSNKEVPLQEKDPVIKDMQDFAQKRGLTLQVHKVSGGIVTEEASYNPNRVNAYIMQAADGKWRVGKSFRIN